VVGRVGGERMHTVWTACGYSRLTSLDLLSVFKSVSLEYRLAKERSITVCEQGSTLVHCQ
jgi:hypothetical protein